MKKLIRTIPFSHADKECDVRVTRDERNRTYIIQVFAQNEPYEIFYTVTFEEVEPNALPPIPAPVASLVRLAKSNYKKDLLGSLIKAKDLLRK